MEKLVGADRVVFSCRNRARFDALEAIFGIAEEIDLAELAVVDDVNADIGLLLHDFGDRAAQSLGEYLFVIRLARELLAEELFQIGRAMQRSGMGGQNPVCAAMHVSSTRSRS